MAREDRPYLPWFFKDWLTSPDRFSMTYEQRGVYRDLLDFAWDQRGLPTDKEQLRAMLGLDKRKFALVWPEVARHFTEQNGRLVNAKQERVRAEMDAYRERKREAGARGGTRRAERLAKAKQTASTATSKPLAEVKPSSSSSSSTTTTSAVMEAKQAVTVQHHPLIAKRNLSAIHEHPRYDVPAVWHQRRVTGLAGGEDAMARFYRHLDAHVDAHPHENTVPRLDWLTRHFDAWAAKLQKPAPSSSDVPDVEETRRRLGIA